MDQNDIKQISSCTFRFSFGKYRGFYVEETPLDYLSWALAELRLLPKPMTDRIRTLLQESGYQENGHLDKRPQPDRPRQRAAAHDDQPDADAPEFDDDIPF